MVIQGADAAATEGKLTDVKVEYVYGTLRRRP